MRGLELSEKFYNEFGKPMIEKDFADIRDKLCCGLVGSGSECFGFDDEISQDHDFEPGFCIFIPGEDEIGRRRAFELERAYAKLPKEFMGYKRSPLSPAGGNRHGVITIGDFYKTKTGHEDGALTLSDWMTLPEFYLAEATNGKVFFDNLGLFSEIRSKLSNMPENIRLKKLSGNLILMNQSGKYNYPRCLSHSETAAAQMALYEFVQHTLRVIFLLNRKYMPFYKWSFRALRSLNLLSDFADPLEYLITTENDKITSNTKLKVIDDIVFGIVSEIKKSGISEATCDDLEKHAFSINDHISDSDLRNADILFGA